MFIAVVHMAGIWGPVAQLVEHLTFNQGVTGSNPVGPTNQNKDLALTVLSPFFILGTHWAPRQPHEFTCISYKIFGYIEVIMLDFWSDRILSNRRGHGDLDDLFRIRKLNTLQYLTLTPKPIWAFTASSMRLARSLWACDYRTYDKIKNYRLRQIR